MASIQVTIRIQLIKTQDTQTAVSSLVDTRRLSHSQAAGLIHLIYWMHQHAVVISVGIIASLLPFIPFIREATALTGCLLLHLGRIPLHVTQTGYLQALT